MSPILLLVAPFCLLILITYFLTTTSPTSKKRKLEFIHIPKNAGTTIEYLGKKHNIPWGRFNMTLNSIDNNICSFWHIPPKHLKAGTSVYDKSPTFCVIRDPFDRIVSAYVYLHRFNPSRLNATDMNEWLQLHLPRISKSVENDCHFLPQHEFIFRDDASPTCEHILNFHELDSQFNSLMQKYSLDVDITTVPKKNTMGTTSLTSKDLDSKSRSLIRSIYTKDLKLINSISKKKCTRINNM